MVGTASSLRPLEIETLFSLFSVLSAEGGEDYVAELPLCIHVIVYKVIIFQ